MKWVLIFITYWDGQIMTVGNGVFDDMIECFYAREQLSTEVGGGDGYFPINMQAVCVLTDTLKPNL